MDRAGVSPNMFPSIVSDVEREIQRAGTFQFSYDEKCFLIKCILLPKFFYAARVSQPQAHCTQKLTRALF